MAIGTLIVILEEVILRISGGRRRLRTCGIFMREGVFMVLNSF